MYGYIYVLVLSLAVLGITPGCSTDPVTVPISISIPATQQAATQSRAVVKVYDIRKQAEMERTTIGKLSLGKITLTPPVPEVVKTMVQTKADTVLARRTAAEPVTVSCGIREFDVTTPATMLYWDVTAKIELVLRVGDQDRNVSGVATERTYIWPSDDMIQRVAREALAKVGNETERALTDLISATP